MTTSLAARATATLGFDGTPPSNNDGIVTVAELGTLKLEGTELVVLSACETGIGAIKSGEGVLGLRRGFIQAGAQNLLMTLWTVADEETVQFMADFSEAAHESGNPGQSLAGVQRDWLEFFGFKQLHLTTFSAANTGIVPSDPAQPPSTEAGFPRIPFEPRYSADESDIQVASHPSSARHLGWPRVAALHSRLSALSLSVPVAADVRRLTLFITPISDF